MGGGCHGNNKGIVMIPCLPCQNPRREGLGLVTLHITSCSKGLQLSYDIIASAHTHHLPFRLLAVYIPNRYPFTSKRCQLVFH